MKCITSKKTIGKVALLSLIFFSISMYGLLAQLNRNPYEENANEPNDEAYRIIKFSVLPGVEEKTGLALEGIQLLEFVGHSS